MEAIEPWLFKVSAYPEESFGHFLGRFRRANQMKSSYLSSILGLRHRTVSYWETPSRRRMPASKDLETLSRLTGVDVAQFRSMLSPDDTLYLRTRLCALCYTETPFYKVTWQDARLWECDRHRCELCVPVLNAGAIFSCRPIGPMGNAIAVICPLRR